MKGERHSKKTYIRRFESCPVHYLFLTEKMDTGGCISCIRQYPDSVQKSVLLYQLGKL